MTEELQDDALSDGGEDDLSPEDHGIYARFIQPDCLAYSVTERLNNGWEQIRAMMGDEEQSGITDSEIKDTLYHYYFDVQQSLNWLYGKSVDPPSLTLYTYMFLRRRTTTEAGS